MWGKEVARGLFAASGPASIVSRDVFRRHPTGDSHRSGPGRPYSPRNTPTTRGLFANGRLSQRANLLTALLALARPDMDLLPTRHELPLGMDLQGYLELMARMMEESKMVAQAVALRQAGYQVRVRNLVRVEQVLPKGTARGLLEPGDPNHGHRWSSNCTIDELKAHLQGRSAGDEVACCLLREDGTGRVLCSHRQRVRDSELPAFEIVVGPHHQIRLPMEIAMMWATSKAPPLVDVLPWRSSINWWPGSCRVGGQ